MVTSRVLWYQANSSLPSSAVSVQGFLLIVATRCVLFYVRGCHKLTNQQKDIRENKGISPLGCSPHVDLIITIKALNPFP